MRSVFLSFSNTKLLAVNRHSDRYRRLYITSRHTHTYTHTHKHTHTHTLHTSQHTHTHTHILLSSLFSAIKSLNVALFRCQLLSSPRMSSLAWPPCENLWPFGLLVGSLLPVVLLLVGTAVTSVLDAKIFPPGLSIFGRSQWPHGLSRRFAAARLLRLWVRIPLVAWMFSVVKYVCCLVEVSVTTWSQVQTSPTEYGESLGEI